MITTTGFFSRRLKFSVTSAQLKICFRRLEGLEIPLTQLLEKNISIIYLSSFHGMNHIRLWEKLNLSNKISPDKKKKHVPFQFYCIIMQQKQKKMYIIQCYTVCIRKETFHLIKSFLWHDRNTTLKLYFKLPVIFPKLIMPFILLANLMCF